MAPSRVRDAEQKQLNTDHSCTPNSTCPGWFTQSSLCGPEGKEPEEVQKIGWCVWMVLVASLGHAGRGLQLGPPDLG